MKNYDSLDRLNFGEDDQDEKSFNKKVILAIVGIIVFIVIISLLIIFLIPNNKKGNNKNQPTTVTEKKKNKDKDKDKDEDEKLEDDQIEIVLDGLDDIVITDDDDAEEQKEEKKEEKPKEEEKETTEKEETKKEEKKEETKKQEKKETSTQKTYAFSYPLDIMDVGVENGTLSASYKGKETKFYLETYLSNTMDDVVANIDTLKANTIKNFGGSVVLNEEYSYKEINKKMWYIANGKLDNQNFSSGYTAFKEGIVVVSIISKDSDTTSIYKDITDILNSAKLKE